MSTVKRIAIFIFSIYGFAVFLVLMLLLFPFFIVGLLWPQPTGGNIIYKIAYIWAWLFFLLSAIRYKPVYLSKPQKGRSYIFVTNHISYLDIPMMILITRGFRVRILAKAEMGNIPVFGFIYNKGAITVRRDNEEHRKRSIQKLMETLQKKISILICPEGTFNMSGKPLKSFFDGAFRIADELQIPILPVIFPDTYDRLNYRSVFSLTPGRCRAVFLAPVEVGGTGARTMQQLKETVYLTMEEEILKLDVNWTGRPE